MTTSPKELKRIYDLLEKEYLQKIISEADIVGIHEEKDFSVIMQYVFCLPAHELLKSLGIIHFTCNIAVKRIIPKKQYSGAADQRVTRSRRILAAESR